MTLIRVGKITTIGSDNGLSPGRRQAIISFSAGILLIGYIRINFSEIISDKSYVSIKGNALQNVVYGMMAICLDLNL